MSQIAASGLSRDYYARRAEQERLAAERTTDAVARRVHLELAERYEQEAGALTSPSATAAG